MAEKATAQGASVLAQAATEEVEGEHPYFVRFNGEDDAVRIIQPLGSMDTGGGEGGTTGWTVWNASFVLLRYLEKCQATLLRQKSVLDVSGGLGLLALASYRGGAARAVCTEFGTKQLAAMQLNLDLNRIPKNAISKVNYKWGDDVKSILEWQVESESEALSTSADADAFNVILMGDLLYICLRDEINEALANTIVDLLAWNTKATLLFSYEVRLQSAERAFLVQCQELAQKKHSFTLNTEAIPRSELDFSDLDDDDEGGMGLESLMKEEVEIVVLKMTNGKNTPSTAAPSSLRVLHGKCYCGEIVYEAATPGGDISVIHCHCKGCRDWTGGIAYSAVPCTSITFMQGKSLLREYQRKCGPTKLFCSSCGTGIANRLRSPFGPASFTHTCAAGLFEESDTFSSALHCQMTGKVPWADTTADRKPTFDGFPR